MADADFWHNQADQFRAFQTFGEPDAEWTVTEGVRTWTVTGHDPSARLRFESLAKRCGLALAPSQQNPLATWLNAVYGNDPNFVNPNGKFPRAKIHSAYYCDQLENQALDELAIQIAPSGETPMDRLEDRLQLLESEIHLVRSERNFDLSGTRAMMKASIEAEARAHGQVEFEKRLKELRKQEGLDEASIEPTTEPTTAGSNKPSPTTAEQLERLRDECDISIEELADHVGIHPTNVARHLRNETIPTRANIRNYKKAFKELLGKEVVISRTQPKRS